MNLLCLSDFNEAGIVARRGEVCWFMPNVADRLLDSWPGAWQKIAIPKGVRSFGPVEEVVTEAIEAAPVDKMIRKAGKRK